jgi:serine/threonine protein kinase
MQLPTILDDTYEILSPLAQGGMGEIFLATHRRLARNVAVKVLSAEFGAQTEWVARFRREAMILGQLRHPNVVHVLDFNVTADGQPYMAMELIEGPDLTAALSAGRRFSPAETLSIIRQVASALAAAHALNIVHRDLKPENVVLCEVPGQTPVVKVIDFGISLWGEADRITVERTVFGTPEYMAPEQAQGLRDIDARTDQFSLAVLAYTLLKNRPPFSGDTPVAILYQVVHCDPSPVGPFEGWDATPVEKVIQRGMARAREDRYPSVLEFAAALETAMLEGGALSAAASGATTASGTTTAAATTSPERATTPSARAASEPEEPEIIIDHSPTLKTRRPRVLPRFLAAAAIAIGLSLSMASPSGHQLVGHGVGRVREGVRSGWAHVSTRVNALVGAAPKGDAAPRAAVAVARTAI